MKHDSASASVIVRGIGIVVAPVGVIAGFIDFDSEVKGDVK